MKEQVETAETSGGRAGSGSAVTTAAAVRRVRIRSLLLVLWPQITSKMVGSGGGAGGGGGPAPSQCPQCIATQGVRSSARRQHPCVPLPNHVTQ